MFWINMPDWAERTMLQTSQVNMSATQSTDTLA